MEELDLDNALESCQMLERSLAGTIHMVHDMNVRYNIDCVERNLRAYIHFLVTKSSLAMEVPSISPNSTAKKLPTSKKVPAIDQHRIPKIKKKIIGSHDLSTRSSQELIDFNKQLNFNFIKIKRSLETVMNNLHRVIKKAECQPDYTKFDYNWRVKKFNFDRILR